MGASAEVEKAVKPTSGGAEDIMSVLLAHERRGGSAGAAAGATKAILPQDSNSESSDDEAFKDITVPSPG